MGSAVTWLTREQVHQINYRGVANLMHPSFRSSLKHKGPTGKKPVGPMRQ